MAFLVCIRSHLTGGNNKKGSVWIKWDSPAELFEADRELLDAQHGCGDRLCERAHILAWHDEFGGTHVSHSVHDRVDLPSLDALYPRQSDECPPETWPTPDELNEPFERPQPGSGLAERISRGESVALAQMLAEATAVLPNGPPSSTKADELGVAGMAVTPAL